LICKIIFVLDKVKGHFHQNVPQSFWTNKAVKWKWWLEVQVGPISPLQLLR